MIQTMAQSLFWSRTNTSLIIPDWRTLSIGLLKTLQRKSWRLISRRPLLRWGWRRLDLTHGSLLMWGWAETLWVHQRCWANVWWPARRVRGGGIVQPVRDHLHEEIIGGLDSDLQNEVTVIEPAPEGKVWVLMPTADRQGVCVWGRHFERNGHPHRSWTRGREDPQQLEVCADDVNPELCRISQQEELCRRWPLWQKELGITEDEPPKSEEGGKDSKETNPDARVLDVDYDTEGERFKEWRQVTLECRDFNFSDWPLDGPLTTQHFLKHTARHGGDPKRWLAEWMRAKQIQEGDRVSFEMKVLIECLYIGGTYDQLNLSGLASIEIIARRIQAIVDAYSAGPIPDWHSAKVMTLYRSPEDAISPQLRSWAARRNKEELDLAQTRAKVREGRRGLLSPEESGAAAIADGALPAAGPKPKPRPRGRGKGLEAPPAQWVTTLGWLPLGSLLTATNPGVQGLELRRPAEIFFLCPYRPRWNVTGASVGDLPRGLQESFTLEKGWEMPSGAWTGWLVSAFKRIQEFKSSTVFNLTLWVEHPFYPTCVTTKESFHRFQSRRQPYRCCSKGVLSMAQRRRLHWQPAHSSASLFQVPWKVLQTHLICWMGVPVDICSALSRCWDPRPSLALRSFIHTGTLCLRISRGCIRSSFRSYIVQTIWCTHNLRSLSAVFSLWKSLMGKRYEWLLMQEAPIVFSENLPEFSSLHQTVFQGLSWMSQKVYIPGKQHMKLIYHRGRYIWAWVTWKTVSIVWGSQSGWQSTSALMAYLPVGWVWKAQFSMGWSSVPTVLFSQLRVLYLWASPGHFSLLRK